MLQCESSIYGHVHMPPPSAVGCLGSPSIKKNPQRWWGITNPPMESRSITPGSVGYLPPPPPSQRPRPLTRRCKFRQTWGEIRRWYFAVIGPYAAFFTSRPRGPPPGGRRSAGDGHLLTSRPPGPRFSFVNYPFLGSQSRSHPYHDQAVFHSLSNVVGVYSSRLRGGHR
jgi:hypothetical protein